MFQSFNFRGYPFLIINSPGAQILLVLAVVWTLIWKGIALWRAGRNNQPVWFVVLFLVNTLGILDIIYLLFFSQKKHYEIV
jgi:methionyl-tRNA synthetase